MTEKVVSFSQMKDGTAEDYEILKRLEDEFASRTDERLMKALAAQADETLEGYKISRLDHALQCATRAVRDDADADWVVAALLHDIGDGLAPRNHDEFAAAILRPFVREEVTWTVQHHGLFQVYYYGHFHGWDRNEREKFKDNAYYQSCVDFCERWDQSSFDPLYEAMPLEAFRGAVCEVFSRPPYDMDVVKAGEVVGLPRGGVGSRNPQIMNAPAEI